MLRVLPITASEGLPLEEWVRRRVGDAGLEDVVAFIQQWDYLATELERQPTLEEYGDRWRRTSTEAARELALFRLAFPGEETPPRLIDQLWELRRHAFGPLLDARIEGGDSVAAARGSYAAGTWRTYG